jgi:hypothetical protein
MLVVRAGVAAFFVGQRHRFEILNPGIVAVAGANACLKQASGQLPMGPDQLNSPPSTKSAQADIFGVGRHVSNVPIGGQLQRTASSSCDTSL